MSMPVSVHELFSHIPADSIRFKVINNSILAADRGIRKEYGSIKIAVEHNIAENFMRFDNKEQIGVLLMIERESFEKARETVLPKAPELTKEEG